MKDIIIYTAKIAIGLALVLSIAVFLFSDKITYAFMKDSEIVALGGTLLKYASPTCLFLAIDFLSVGIFQACGLGLYAFIFAILRKVVLEIPLLYVWNKVYPLYGLAFAQPTAELVLAIVACIIVKKIIDGKLPVEKNR